MTLEELLAKRKAAVEAAEAVEKAAKDAGRDLSAEDVASIDRSLDEAASLDAEIVEAQKVATTTAARDRLAKARERAAGLTTPGLAPTSATPLVATPASLRSPTFGFRSFGEFAQSVRQVGPSGVPQDDRLRAVATGLQQGVGPEGGFLLAPQFSTTLWDGVSKNGASILPFLDQYTVTGEFVEFPAQHETSRATGSRWGGVQAYWIAEAEQMTKSKPKFRKMRLEPQQLAVMAYVTDKLLANSPLSLEQYLTRVATDEITFLVNDAVIRGDGVGKPRGWLPHSALVSVTKATNQPASTIYEQNIGDAWMRLHPMGRSRALWLANPSAEAQFDRFFQPIKNVAGTENVGGLKNDTWDGAKRTLKGRPVLFLEQMEAVGTVGDLLLVDPLGYALGTRGGIDAGVSIHLRFDYNETAFRFLFAVDGQPWITTALSPYKGADTLTTHVAVATR